MSNPTTRQWGLLLACALYLYVNLFSITGTPNLLSGDQVYFWGYAQRLLNGEHVYRDFFQFTPPGTDLVFWAAFRLCGPRIWVTNLVVLAVSMGLCWVCLQLARSVLDRSLATLATCLYLVLVIGLTLNATHHLFSALAVSAAVAVLMGGRTKRRLAVAGMLLGIASFFTQTRGAVAAVAIIVWLLWEQIRSGEFRSDSLRSQLLLLASLLLTWIALSGYYLSDVGLRQLWFFQVDYVRTYLITPWPSLPRQWSLTLLIALPFAFVALPLIYLAALWRCGRVWRSGSSQRTSRLLLLSLVGAALYVEVAQGPSWLRFFCVALPGVVLLVWLIGETGRFSRYASAALWVAVMVLAGYQTWSKHRFYPSMIGTPAGYVRTTGVSAEKLSWLESHTRPGQFWLESQWPGMYLPLALRNPIYLDQIAQVREMPAYSEQSIQRLETRHVQYIEWSPALERPDSTIGSFRSYLTARYRCVWTFSDADQIWERIEQ
jgi:hypothetical protein